MSTIVRVFHTLLRKLEKSVEQRGLWQTSLRSLWVPVRTLRSNLYALSPSRRAYLRAERAFDRRFGVDTHRDLDLGWMADIQSGNWAHGSGYEPAPIESVVATLGELPIERSDYTFVDFGSGKGRSLFLASRFAFERIIGVEYSTRLHGIAEDNIVRYHDAEQQCSNIEAVLGDAASFAIPEGPLVLFFNHPFDEPVFEPVVRSIERSYEISPPKIFVVYYDPQCAEIFARLGIFSTRTRYKSQYVVFETNSALDSRETRLGEPLPIEARSA